MVLKILCVLVSISRMMICFILVLNTCDVTVESKYCSELIFSTSGIRIYTCTLNLTLYDALECCSDISATFHINDGMRVAN